MVILMSIIIFTSDILDLSPTSLKDLAINFKKTAFLLSLPCEQGFEIVLNVQLNCALGHTVDFSSSRQVTTCWECIQQAVT